MRQGTRRGSDNTNIFKLPLVKGYNIEGFLKIVEKHDRVPFWGTKLEPLVNKAVLTSESNLPKIFSQKTRLK